MSDKYRRVLAASLDSVVGENAALRAENERLRAALTEARQEIYSYFCRPYTLPVKFERLPLIQRIDAALRHTEG